MLVSQSGEKKTGAVELKVILCPVDFSSPSRKAAGYVRTLAERFEAEIVVVHVTTSLADYLDFQARNDRLSEINEDTADDVVRELRLFVEEQFSGLKVTAKVIKGDVAEEILKMAARFEAGLIVMGTNGRKGLDRLVFGSVAESIVKESPVPVMTVRP